MNRVSRFCILLLVLLVASACASGKIAKINASKKYDPTAKSTIAVLDFTKAQGIKYNTTVVADMLTTSLLGGDHITIVDRNEIKKVMKEVKFQMSGLIDDRTRKQLSQLGADVILTGTLHKYYEKKRNTDDFLIRSEVYVSAKLLDITTGEVLWSADFSDFDKASNLGKKGLLTGEREAETAEVLLDKAIQKMAFSLKGEKTLGGKLLDSLK